MAAACPDDETLARVAAGEAGSAARDEVMAHLDECAVCRRGLAAIAALPPTPADSFLGGDHASTFPELASQVPTARVPRGPRPAGDAPGIPALGDRIGRYVALRVIGRGGMGVVIAAHDPELDRQIAIKLVHPRVWRAASEGARNLMRLEARAMARLVHPNVVAVHDLGTVGDQLFVAMELVGGSSFDRWLAERERPWRETLTLCLDAGKGIAAAHRAGLVHRDIKPHNVLIDEHGRPRIADFGLAVLGRADPGGEAPAGTPAYMSPEQHRGATVTAASDQFSYCVMVHEALYGVRPFGGETAAAIALELERGALRPAPPGSSVPVRVRRALVRGLATDAADRFASMDELLAALPPRPVSRVALVGGAVALAAAAGASVVLLGRDAGDPAITERRAAERQVAAVWTPAARRAIEHTMTAAAPPLLIAIDRHGAAWIAARIELARATRAGEQAAAAAERRAACLDRQLDELRALVDVIAARPLEVGAAAPSAIASLPPAQRCLERDVMQEPPPPREPALRARHDALVRSLAELRARARLGHLEGHGVDLNVVIADARALNHAPLLADALLLRARGLLRVGELEAALAVYREVVPIAAAARDPEREAMAWLELVEVQLALHQHPADDVMIATAAAVARAGNPPAMVARLSQQAKRAVSMPIGREASDFGATARP